MNDGNGPNGYNRKQEPRGKATTTSVIPSIKCDEVFNVKNSVARCHCLFVCWFVRLCTYEYLFPIHVLCHSKDWIAKEGEKKHAVWWIFNEQFKLKKWHWEKKKYWKKREREIEVKTFWQILIFARSICLPEIIFAIWSFYARG